MKEIEIPFGAFDSELGGFEYTIPEGHEAEIKDGKVIVKRKESEDERTRKRLIDCLKFSLKGAEEQDAAGCSRQKDIEAYKWGIAYLEKQKEPRIKTDACGFPLREHGESACSYLERCLAPDMRHIWYEACAEIKEKQKEQEFTHHEAGESLEEAVTHQMEDDGDVDDFVRKGLDDVVLKYAKFGAEWQKEQKSPEYIKRNSKEWNALLAEQYDKGFWKGKTEQKPAEWSERDDKILASVMAHIADSQSFDHFYDISKDDIYAWLKSLRPRTHWKPSEEQMDALKETAEWKRYSNPQLFSLYEDLQKLM